MTETNHISFEQLSDYVEGRLSATDVARVDTHLATGCTTCQSDLAWLTQTMGLLNVQNEWVAPPDAVKTAVFESYRHAYPKVTLFARWQNWWRAYTAPRPSRWQPTFALAVVLVAFIFSAVLWQSRTAVSPPSIAVVQPTSTVEVDGGTTDQSDALNAGDEIRTDADSSELLTFPDGTTSRLDANTQIDIQRADFSEEGIRDISFYQLIGSTYNEVKTASSSDDRFEIETVTAVIRVSSADFTVDVAASGVTTIKVAMGQVIVTARGTSMVVFAGETAVFPSTPTATQVTSTPTRTPRVTPTITPTTTKTPTPKASATPTIEPSATATSPVESTTTPTIHATAEPPATIAPTSIPNPTDEPDDPNTPEPTDEPDDPDDPEPTEEPDDPDDPEPTEEPD